jgi:hypothetical protein
LSGSPLFPSLPARAVIRLLAPASATQLEIQAR